MDDRKTLLEKIKALLAKTVENGCTEFEMLSAMAKASELMAAHNVDQTDLAFGGEKMNFDDRDVKDPYRIRRGLAVAVSRFCDCECWSRDKEKLTFCGLESDTVFAYWLLDMLAAFVNRETTKYIFKLGGGVRGRERKREYISFSAGCVSRINQRLDELRHREHATGTGRSPIMSKQTMIGAAMRARGIRLKSRSLSRKINSDAFSAGKVAGDGASFNRPVNGGAGVFAIGRY
jgi:hypothetical protein